MGSVPSQRTWVPGLLSSGALNTDVRDTTAFLLNPPLAVVAFSNQQDDGAIQWGTPSVDRDGGFASSDRTKYVAQTAGYYHAVCRIRQENGSQSGDGFYSIFWFATPTGNFGTQAHTTHLSISYTRDYTFSAEFYMSVGHAVTVQTYTIWTGPIINGDWIIRWVGK